MKKQELIKVIDKIYQMDDGELSDVMGAVMARFGQIQPEKELFLLSVPKNDPEEQKRIVEFAVQMIDRSGREEAEICEFRYVVQSDSGTI